MEQEHSAPEQPQNECTTRSSSADLRNTPCTRGDGEPVCQLLWHLEECNHLLFPIGYQLIDQEDDDAGELRLVLHPQQNALRQWESFILSGVHARKAIELFQSLCAVHRCVTLVELDYKIAMSKPILSAIQGGVGVKRVHVYDIHDITRYYPALNNVVLSLVSTMEHVDELVFRKRHQGSISIVPLSSFSLNGAVATTLKRLDVADVNLGDSEVTKLITLLMGNDTMTDLAVGTSVCTFAGSKTSLGFADYLAKAKDTLRSLTLRSVGFCSAPYLARLVNTICKMTVLQELVVDMVPCGKEGTDIFAKVVGRSTSLRHLTVVLPQWWDRCMLNDVYQDPDGRFRSVRRWLAVLPHTNTLETLTLDMMGFLQDECRMLFLALSENSSIRKVTVHRLLEWGCIEFACRVIRACDLAERVVISNHNVSPNSLSKLPTCPEVKAVTVYSHWFQTTLCDIRVAIGTLATCGHLRSLQMHLFDDALSNYVLTTLASCLVAPNRLSDVEVNLHIRLYNPLHGLHCALECPLIRAVSCNPNLNRITLRQFQLSEVDCQLLTDALRRSTNLHGLVLSGDNSGRFLQLMAPMALKNYTLLYVSLSTTDDSDDEMKILVEVTRRNRSLISRAARFVLGENRSPYCAAAIEFVSRHPRLVQVLMHKAAVGEERARKMIRRALESISSMDSFMMVVRVVKDHVECVRQPDGSTQLDQLNYDCWLHVRQYLKVADVLHDCEPVP
ncbi:uncharacterized protein LOC142766823 [Rhipicephalus microplus]|uniref:uncharacterized protein LOC142766823 n=1 Tax=Rhipicephalus microplus TaxID=6941 RepID=UPI0023767DCB